MLDLVDTHCHIQSVGMSDRGEALTRDLWQKAGRLSADDIVSAAADDGVTRLICVGCDLEDSQLAVDFAAKCQRAWASIGIHPHEARHFAGQQAPLQALAALVPKPKVVAIGECGLDFYYQHSPKQAQIEVLEFQIELALSADLPLIFHVREAFDTFWPIVDRYPGIRGVLHSFTDSQEHLAEGLKRGFYIGVNGIITFAKKPAQLSVYKAIPLDKLVLETDAPFLTPVPHRGSINEPKYIKLIADCLAQLRGEELETLATATTANARILFGI